MSLPKTMAFKLSLQQLLDFHGIDGTLEASDGWFDFGEVLLSIGVDIKIKIHYFTMLMEMFVDVY